MDRTERAAWIVLGRESDGVAAAILYMLAFTLELAVSLATYFAEGAHS